MAIIRNTTDLDSPINYLATLAFFCSVSCTILMLKFRGFKASLNLSSWRKDDEIATPITLTGAYRINRDEFYGNGRVYDPPKKLDPSMVKLPPSFDPEPSLRPNKSTSDLVKPNLPLHIQLHKSTNDVSLDPRGGPSTPDRTTAPPPPPERKKKDAKNREKEQKKLEKQRLAEEKARQKAAAQEQAKQEKLRKDTEKRAAQEEAKAKKNKKKTPAPPQPVPLQPAPPPPAPAARGPKKSAPVPPPLPLSPPPAPYSTNTLDSSISRSSGPPPYSELSTSNPQEAQTANPSDVSFGKPIDKPTDSWDLISQHRQQMNRPVTSGVPKGPRKHMVMDLQYKLGPVEDKDNSEA